MITIFFPAGWSHEDVHHWFRDRDLPFFFSAESSGHRRIGYAFIFTP